MKVNKWKFIVGILLLPILLSIYMIDRMVLVLFIHIPSHNFLKWSDNNENIKHSLMRIFAMVVVYYTFQFFFWLF